MLHGREAERSQLSAMLDAAHEGRAASVVIRGGAGMGTSALLDDTAARARGTVLRTAGLQSESALAFAGLHRLLRPVQARVSVLPDPQKIALRVAFGAQTGDRPDPFIVGLATAADRRGRRGTGVVPGRRHAVARHGVGRRAAVRDPTSAR